MKTFLIQPDQPFAFSALQPPALQPQRFWSNKAFRLTGLGQGLEGWRAGGLEGWRAGGLEGWRAGGLEGWRAGGLNPGGLGAGGLEGWRA